MDEEDVLSNLEDIELSEDELKCAEIAEKLSLVKLPNNKHHVSFSELGTWVKCSWSHKLRHVDGVDLSKPSPHADFGTAVHAACESFLKTRVMDDSIAKNLIKELWEKNRHAEPSDSCPRAPEDFKLDVWLHQAERILYELPTFMDTTFPNWEFVDAEHLLYERIFDKPHAFKGYVDCVIKVPKGKKFLTWIIDFKTCAWGWKREKRSDRTVASQIVYYKDFYAKKSNLDPRDVRCGFLLLKRTAKDGVRCELIPVSAGAVTTQRALKVVTDMVWSLNNGIALKNRYGCHYCDYSETEHCSLIIKKK